MKFWNAEIECMERKQLHELQLHRLKQTVKNVAEHVPYYARKMTKKGISAADINTLDDLKKLPFTDKEDLRKTYPFGMFASPLEDIIRVHASSGTTGKQTVVGYTRTDIENWSENMARCLIMAGVKKDSRIQNCYGYGLFTGGLGVHYGVERVGAIAIPASTGNTERQINMLRDFKSTCICCTPSYALYLADTMKQMGINKHELSLTSGIFGAEPWTEEMRQKIESQLGLKAFDIYGLSEIMGPSVSQECACQNGLHIWEDSYIAEVINPDTGEVLTEGEPGCLVITTINKEGIPLIRYKTGDICSLTKEPCDCGRTHTRMTKPIGRTDDMLIIRGVNVFPTQIESVLLNFTEVSPHYQIVVDRINNLDHLNINIELNDYILPGYPNNLDQLSSLVTKKLESVIGIAAKINIVEPQSIKRSEGKAVRVIDNRRILLSKPIGGNSILYEKNIIRQ